MILVTGSEGLLGSRLTSILRKSGLEVREFDIRRNIDEDTRNINALRSAMNGVDGIVHLAAISRVVWAEKNPKLADAVNVKPLESLLSAALELKSKPWMVFASSREVYGNSPNLPVSDEAPFRPLNVYARSKVAGERLISKAIEAGLLANICRFSNVYGSANDHFDRVAVAFARTAALGGTLRIEGAKNMFDFTHVDDVARGLAVVVEATRNGEQLPPLHFVSGQGVTLGELAQLAVDSSDPNKQITLLEAAARDFDVSKFVGNPDRTHKLLGWKTSKPLSQGFTELINSIVLEDSQNEIAPAWINQLLQ